MPPGRSARGLYLTRGWLCPESIVRNLLPRRVGRSFNRSELRFSLSRGAQNTLPLSGPAWPASASLCAGFRALSKKRPMPGKNEATGPRPTASGASGLGSGQRCASSRPPVRWRTRPGQIRAWRGCLSASSSSVSPAQAAGVRKARTGHGRDRRSVDVSATVHSMAGKGAGVG